MACRSEGQSKLPASAQPKVAAAAPTRVNCIPALREDTLGSLKAATTGSSNLPEIKEGRNDCYTCLIPLMHNCPLKRIGHV